EQRAHGERKTERRRDPPAESADVLSCGHGNTPVDGAGAFPFAARGGRDGGSRVRPGWGWGLRTAENQCVSAATSLVWMGTRAVTARAWWMPSEPSDQRSARYSATGISRTTSRPSGPFTTRVSGTKANVRPSRLARTRPGAAEPGR